MAANLVEKDDRITLPDLAHLATGRRTHRAQRAPGLARLLPVIPAARAAIRSGQYTVAKR